LYAQNWLKIKTSYLFFQLLPSWGGGASALLAPPGCALAFNAESKSATRGGAKEVLDPPFL